jgi:hypothetical protein
MSNSKIKLQGISVFRSLPVSRSLLPLIIAVAIIAAQGVRVGFVGTG